MNEPPGLRPEIAASLGVDEGASPEAIARRFAALSKRPQPTRPETVKCIVETVRSAEVLWELHGGSSAGFAASMEVRVWKAVSLDEARIAEAELEIPPSEGDVVWRLAEHMWNILVAAEHEQ